MNTWDEVIKEFRVVLREVGFTKMFAAMRVVKGKRGHVSRAVFWWMIADASAEDWMAIVKEAKK